MAFIVWKQQTKQWNDKWTWIALDRFICATVQCISPGCTWLQYHSQKSFNKVQRRAEVPWKSSRFICWFVKLNVFVVCLFAEIRRLTAIMADRVRNVHQVPCWCRAFWRVTLPSSRTWSEIDWETEAKTNCWTMCHLVTRLTTTNKKMSNKWRMPQRLFYSTIDQLLLLCVSLKLFINRLNLIYAFNRYHT